MIQSELDLYQCIAYCSFVVGSHQKHDECHLLCWIEFQQCVVNHFIMVWNGWIQVIIVECVVQDQPWAVGVVVCSLQVQWLQDLVQLVGYE